MLNIHEQRHYALSKAAAEGSALPSDMFTAKTFVCPGCIGAGMQAHARVTDDNPICPVCSGRGFTCQP
jgi:hypothetical protein